MNVRQQDEWKANLVRSALYEKGLARVEPRELDFNTFVRHTAQQVFLQRNV
jgi:hypothetical protein